MFHVPRVRKVYGGKRVPLRVNLFERMVQYRSKGLGYQNPAFLL